MAGTAQLDISRHIAYFRNDKQNWLALALSEVQDVVNINAQSNSGAVAVRSNLPAPDPPAPDPPPFAVLDSSGHLPLALMPAGLSQAVLKVVSPLPVANGGTGAFTPSAARVNLAVAGVKSKTAAYQLVADDSTINADAIGGAFAVTLDTAGCIAGQSYTIKKVDSSVNAVTLNTTAGNIDGVATQSLSTQYSAFTVYTDNANWWIRSKL